MVQFFKQRKALDSITPHLDYLESTVHKFLNLGRIERGDLAVTKTELNSGKTYSRYRLDSLKPMPQRKNFTIENEIDRTCRINADQ